MTNKRHFFYLKIDTLKPLRNPRTINWMKSGQVFRSKLSRPSKSNIASLGKLDPWAAYMASQEMQNYSATVVD